MPTKNEIIDKILEELEGEISIDFDIEPKDPQLFLELLDEIEISGGDSIDNREELISPDAKQKKVLFKNKDGVVGELKGGGSSGYRNRSNSVEILDISGNAQIVNIFPGIIELWVSIGVGVASNILTNWISKLFVKYYNRFRMEKMSLYLKSKKHGYIPIEIDLLFELIKESLEDNEYYTGFINDQKKELNAKTDKEKIKKLDKDLQKELEGTDDEIKELLDKTIKEELIKIIRKAKKEKEEKQN